jgi:protein CpxP
MHKTAIQSRADQSRRSNMKNYTKLFVPVFLAILIGSLTFVFAQKKDDANKPPFPGGDRGDRGGMMPPPNGLNPRMLDELNLTAEQKTQVKGLMDKTRSDSEQFFEELKTSDAQLRLLTESGNFNEEKARQILSVKTQAQTEMEIIRLRADAAIYNLLTAEQKTQLAQIKEQRPQMPPNGGGFRPKER